MAESAAEFVPETSSLPKLRDAAESCTGCDLYKNATQTVFGEGTRNAELMLVGEQPGDHEDIQGKPFVGPAGGLLDKALAEAGIDRKKVYVTNVVKHFKWERRGKRRIHKKPSLSQISACRPWLDAEVDAVGPKIIVAMGATAAQALLGKSFRVTQQRGEFIANDGMPVMTATVHPSAILRAPDEETRRLEFKYFAQDFNRIADRLEKL
jgi:uracil-DNA glycosylase family protein